jgi:hypothetical protein
MVMTFLPPPVLSPAMEGYYLGMSATRSGEVWGQELRAHWPQAWRFQTGRDVLLETFAPEVFTVTSDAIFLRYGENQDLRISEQGTHLRILTLEPMDERIAEAFDKVIRVIKPDVVNKIEASFSHVYPLHMEYDDARRNLANTFYGSWIRLRPAKDFALVWDEQASPDHEGHFELGVVNSAELISRIAEASEVSADLLRRHTPAWMKVRTPRVALFMKSKYSSSQRMAVDTGRAQAPNTWKRWRERSDQLFNMLAELAIPAQRGGVS